MLEVERILLTLGYYADDEIKKIQVQNYINEAESFMLAAGVPKSKITSASAAAVRLMWAEARDCSGEIDLAGKNSIILSIIEQLRSESA